ncbi:rCG63133 [Rattus norvegicus]|uniref:RCG63133 n=1 Tax=Rattus norvegicus TaxID=10116 RepID=A6KCY3_RAT|nr:rCG63133 [Rattus norvegicus]
MTRLVNMTSDLTTHIYLHRTRAQPSSGRRGDWEALIN